jgi:adhesin HecA-like repeat protein
VKSSASDRAQVASLGSLLLVAVVVISAGTFGAYYVASTTDGAMGGAAGGAGGAEGIDVAIGVTQDELRLSHNGGASVSTSNLQIVVENASGEYTYAFNDGTVRGGNGDAQFDPGETWRLGWDQSPNTEVTVSLVDTDANRLLFQRTVTTGSPATERPANIAGGEEVTGELGGEESGEADDSDDAIEPTEPWLDTDDDGVFEPDAGDVNVSLATGSVPDRYSEKASSSTLRVPNSVTVDTDNREIKLKDALNVRIAGTLETKGEIKVKPSDGSGYVDLTDGRIDNTQGGGNSVTLDSRGTLTVTAATVRSKGEVKVKSEGRMDASNVDLDNTQGGGNSITLNSEGALVADDAAISSKGEIKLKSERRMDLSGASVDNTQGGGNSITLDSEDALDAGSATVRAKGEIKLKSEGRTDLSGATVDNSQGGGNSITLDSEDRLSASSATVRTKGEIKIKSNGRMNLSGANINNAQGGGSQITLDSEDRLTASNATVRAKGQIKVKSEGRMDLSDAAVDNSQGGGNSVTFTVEDSGNLSLVGTDIDSKGSATASVPGDEYTVDVTDANIDDKDDFLNVSPTSAVTGDPAAGDAG